MAAVHPYQKYFQSSDTFATTLLLLAVDQWGTECLEWAPETLQLEIMDDFGVDVQQIVLDRLMCAISLVTTNFFYHSLPSFIQMCNVLSGTAYDPSVFDPADPYEMAWAMTEAEIIFPAGDEEQFAPQIVGYISDSIMGMGLSNVPKIFTPFVQDSELPGVNNDVFDSDPVLLQAIYDNQASSAADIDSAVHKSLQLLMQQVASLQLQNGDAKDAVLRAINSTD